MTYLRAALIAQLCLLPLPMVAQEELTVSPELRAAALDWLNADDTMDALWAIGELAIDGDVLAQEFANTLYRIHVPSAFADLPHADRLALFPRPLETTRFRPYAGIPSDHPVNVAKLAIGRSETAQDWIANADILLEAGLMRDFQTSLRLAFGGNQDHIAIEATLYADPLVDGTDAIQADIWMYRGLENMLTAYREEWYPARSAAHQVRWGDAPWSKEAHREFIAALDDGRWTAIRAFAFLRTFSRPTEATIFLPDRPALAEFADIYTAAQQWSFQGPLHTSPEILEAVGGLLVADAAQSTYLLPLLNVCSAACGDAVASCMAVGVLNRFDDQHILSGRIEPVLTFDEYAASNKAAAQMMSAISFYNSPRATRPLAVALPTCLADAAAN